MAAQKYLLRAGIVGIIALVSWVAYISSKQIARNERIENEVGMLQSEADRIKRENETLSEKIGYFSTADFREQEAKEKLGMKKESEEAVLIKSRPVQKQVEEVRESQIDEASVALVRIPNYRKWWNLFFGTT